MVLFAKDAQLHKVVADEEWGVAFVHDMMAVASGVVQLVVVAGTAVGFAMLQVGGGGGLENLAEEETRL